MASLVRQRVRVGRTPAVAQASRLCTSEEGHRHRRDAWATECRRGFTLIETAMTTVIIGVGVLALVEAQQAFMRSNAWSTNAATATYLANEVRELMRPLPRHDPVTGLYFDKNNVLRGWGPENGEEDPTQFDDVDDFDGITFFAGGSAGVTDGDLPGPIDGFGEIIPEIDSSGNPVFMEVESEEGEATPVQLALQGWRQTVSVTKVDPTNPTVTYLKTDTIAPSTGFNGLEVDEFPLRVTVTVQYTGPFEEQPTNMISTSWIVP